MSALIELKDLRKNFSNEKVLNGLSMELPRGCCYGLLGRNGAGKTTAIKIIMGFLKQDSGSVLLLGENPREIPPALKAKVGYVSENQILPEHLTAGDLARFNRGLYPCWDEALFNGLLEKHKIKRSKAVGKLSKGSRKKLPSPRAKRFFRLIF
jgi:ABC-2 type transport system ATP-binding protein